MIHGQLIEQLLKDFEVLRKENAALRLRVSELETKLSRSGRSKICRDTICSAPNKGHCASRATHYYGYKLHATCSASGVFQSMDISPASVHDIHYLKDIKTQLKDCTLIGDRGYISAEYQLNLFDTCKIKLDTPMRRNQKNYKERPYVYRK